MSNLEKAAYICTCSEDQLEKVGCDCRASYFAVVEVDTIQLENGQYVLTFDNKPRGDAAKFTFREAYIAAAAWDGKENGKWEGSKWVDIVYRCKWGAGRKA